MPSSKRSKSTEKVVKSKSEEKVPGYMKFTIAANTREKTLHDEKEAQKVVKSKPIAAQPNFDGEVPRYMKPTTAATARRTTMQKKEQELEAARLLQHTKEEEERSAAKTHMNEHLKKYTQKFIVDLNSGNRGKDSNQDDKEFKAFLQQMRKGETVNGHIVKLGDDDIIKAERMVKKAKLDIANKIATEQRAMRNEILERAEKTIAELNAVNKDDDAFQALVYITEKFEAFVVKAKMGKTIAGQELKPGSDAIDAAEQKVRREKLKYCISMGFTATDMRYAGFSIQVLAHAGHWSCVEAKEAGYTAKECADADFPPKQFLRAFKMKTNDPELTGIYPETLCEKFKKHYGKVIAGIISVTAPMFLLLLPSPDDNIFEDAAIGMPSNATIFCEDEVFDFKVYGFFYDESCARRMKPLKKDDTPCGVTIINDVLMYFVGELRIEAQLFGAVSIVFMIMITQLGGIPVPTPGNKLGILLWSFWMILMFLQTLSLPLAIGVTSLSFLQFREDLKTCAIEWKYGFDNIDVVAMLTFIFQPVVLLKLVLFYIYWGALIEGTKVCYAERNSEALMEQESADSICFGKFRRLNLDIYMFKRFKLLVLLPACSFCLSIFVLSASWAFGIFFVAIIVMIMGNHVILFSLLKYASHHSRNALLMVKEEEKLDETRIDEQSHRRPSTNKKGARTNRLCKLPKFIHEGIQSMTWWVDATTINTKDITYCTFGATISWAYFPLALSPLIVYASWLATYIYAGHTTKEGMALVRHIYEFTFGLFNDRTMLLPSLNFDIANFGSAIFEIVEAFKSINNFGPVEYLGLSFACSLVSFTLSLIKTCACIIAICLYGCGKFVKLPVPFWKLAPEQLRGGGCYFVLKKFEENAVCNDTYYEWVVKLSYRLLSEHHKREEFNLKVKKPRVKKELQKLKAEHEMLKKKNLKVDMPIGSSLDTMDIEAARVPRENLNDLARKDGPKGETAPRSTNRYIQQEAEFPKEVLHPCRGT